MSAQSRRYGRQSDLWPGLSTVTERAIWADRIVRRRPTLVDMQVIVRCQDQKLCASITCMIRHYVARRAKVIFDHPHNAESSVFIAEVPGDPRLLLPVLAPGGRARSAARG
jgi:hypothetical protein